MASGISRGSILSIFAAVVLSIGAAGIYYIMKVQTVEPVGLAGAGRYLLALDLNGRGIQFMPPGRPRIMFDIDVDGFEEPVGWGIPGTAYLVNDRDRDGAIRNGAELVGRESGGMAKVLSDLDGNSDGIIDKKDPAWALLGLWVEKKRQDGRTGADELISLPDAGILSLDLREIDDSRRKLAGGKILETAKFITEDGSGAISWVLVKVDDFNSRYVAEALIPEDLVALPNLSGHGELPSLHQAMLVDPELKEIYREILPKLAVPDLVQLRRDIRPLLKQWAGWNNKHVEGKKDIYVLQAGGNLNVTLHDVAYDFDGKDGKDAGWRLLSGQPFLDSDGRELSDPDEDDVAAQKSDLGEWVKYEGERFTFLERYLGQPVPINLLRDHPAVIKAMESYVNYLRLAEAGNAVRLAVQGPLRGEFPDLELDLVRDRFINVGGTGLETAYAAMFKAASLHPAGAETYLSDWSDFHAIIINGYDRGGRHLLNSYAFQLSQMMRGREIHSPGIPVETMAQALGFPEEFVLLGKTDLKGTLKNDLFVIGEGTQTASGGRAHDVYLIEKSFGKTLIRNRGYKDPQDRIDVLRFPFHALSDLDLRRSGADLLITQKNGGGEVRVEGQFAEAEPGKENVKTGLDEFLFADRRLLNRFTIANFAPLRGGETGGVLTGSSGVDVFHSSPANDHMIGGSGADRYYFKGKIGNDVIEDLSPNQKGSVGNQIIFEEGPYLAGAGFARQGDDLLIRFAGDVGTLLVRGQFALPKTEQGKFWFPAGIDLFTFADGDRLYTRIWIHKQIMETWRTDGDDVIRGFYRPDEIDGGPGNDLMMGGPGGDNYWFKPGYGHDVIDDGGLDDPAEAPDKLLFGRHVDPASTQFRYLLDSGDVLATLSDGSTVRIRKQIDPGSHGRQPRLELLLFQKNADVAIKADLLEKLLLAEGQVSGARLIEASTGAP